MRLRAALPAGGLARGSPRVRDQLDHLVARVHAELLVDAPDVVFDGVLAHGELLRYGTQGPSLRQLDEELRLARRQVEGPGERRAPRRQAGFGGDGGVRGGCGAGIVTGSDAGVSTAVTGVTGVSGLGAGPAV